MHSDVDVIIYKMLPSDSYCSVVKLFSLYLVAAGLLHDKQKETLLLCTAPTMKNKLNLRFNAMLRDISSTVCCAKC